MGVRWISRRAGNYPSNRTRRVGMCRRRYCGGGRQCHPGGQGEELSALKLHDAHSKIVYRDRSYCAVDAIPILVCYPSISNRNEALVTWDQRIKHRLKLKDLDILMTVIQAGSMGKAADHLNMFQPTISKSIADLEHTLGVRLLDRKPQGVEPTPYALALVRRSAAAFNELKQGVQEIENLADP